MSSTPPPNTTIDIEDCLKRISLIESTFRFCSTKEIGVYETAARQILEHVEALRAQLLRLRRAEVQASSSRRAA